ncbi:hypothetical protein G6F70_008805 [Rhizopus microsporus]|uniref:Transcription initiation factor TFIID subunit 1 histone acetyltransferase domain-containing protein n=1 Tax=Rhizopus microsporus TaxID=58291 RepID=A0A1X0RL87_RHIZD|nr:hypothetical protein G6F71_007845 [Rhizopus microsporus]KAG1194605.1 hypothetical protein G6F70_008805 [Rhizopus microsporus]KAG1206510.1 hypothetical protein G6F69_008780 [Rhizopus microsporus]KAG1226910.1 hypothetical protein G6F67_008751 [Rhizopus microsporus]KAG1258631.1 hypothetical protein G6F68_008654 [Rhizopus microsporus]
MSLAGYFFGNVDEQGRLESDLDDELRETLSSVDAGVISKIFSDDTFGLEHAQAVDEDEEEETVIRSSIPTVHSSDAVDYSDFNEAVPDDPMFSEKYFKKGMGVVQKNLPRSRLSLVTENYDDEEENEVEEQQEIKVEQELPTLYTEDQKQRQIDVKQLFPGFEQGKILKFSELFMTRIQRPPKLQSNKRVIYGDGYEYEVERDDRSVFMRASKWDRLKLEQAKQPIKRRRIEPTNEDEASSSNESENEYMEDFPDRPNIAEIPTAALDNSKTFHSIMLEKWEEDIIWDKEDEDMIEDAQATVVNKHLNMQLEEGDWLQAIIWDKERPSNEIMKITLDLNDPNMLFDVEEVEATKELLIQPKHVKKGRKPIPKPLPKIQIYHTEIEPHNKLPLNRFNLSNDKHYETHLAGRLVRVRQTFGQLVVQHALPALKLHPALYKSKLSKAELRSFHRPLIQLPTNTDIHFSRVKANKKKRRDKKKGYMDVMRSTKDLTLKDSTPFVLMEYSEEHPPIISNMGMGTLVVNYYRKTEPKDEHVPNLDIGEPFVLDIGDTSPFMNFGNVEPGQTIPVYYNNLIRAPLFRHEVKHTDFLLIKSTYKGQTKYYLREIPAIYTIGQSYPVQEVPGPHSRKVTTIIKNRLQVVAYRLIKRNPLHRLKMGKLAQKFPEYSDIQIRQRLKEFLEFHRRNKDGGGGYWKTRGGADPPDEEELRKMVTPEMICLYESMLVGERHLQDLGYGDMNDEDETGEGDSNLEVEQQLAPWFSTRNFINAAQGKAMLKLYGAGDPTGRGEGFSFIRVSMKDIFLRAGESAEEKLAQIKARPKSAHRYNVAEQQQIYREEIARIWKAQLDSLSNPIEPELTDQEEEERDTDQVYSPSTSEYDWHRGGPSTPSYHRSRFDRATSELYDDEDDVSVTGSLSSSYHVNNQNKYLIIRRLITQKNGEKTWQQEVVRDPVVIKSYLRQRQMIEEEATNVEGIDPNDDDEKTARMKKRIQDQLAKLKRNAERRRQRQLAKQAALAENPVLGLIRGKREGAMRRCGNCGQLGHMKTNKNCPNFYLMNDPIRSLTELPATLPTDTDIGK